MASKAVEARVSKAQEILKNNLKVENNQIVVDAAVENQLLDVITAETGATKEAVSTILNFPFEVKSAFAIESARVAKNAFSSDKELAEVQGAFNLANFELSSTVKKEHQFRDPSNKDNLITRNLYTQAVAKGKGGFGKGRLTSEIQAIWDASI